MGKSHKASYYLSEAEKAGLRVEAGKGSHFKVYAPENAQIDRDAMQRDYMVMPLHGELSPGLECAVKKWFLRIGIILTFAGIVWVCL